MRFKSDPHAGELNGFLDSGSRMEGELHFDASFRIDGKFTGKVLSDGNLIIGEEGEVDGEIRVGQLLVSGTVRGQVQTRRSVQIAAGGKVLADLETPSLVIEDGALFEGHCSMSPSEAPAKGSEGASVAPLVKPMPAAKGRGG